MNIERAFWMADRYYQAGNVLHGVGRGYFMCPQIVCSAFSLEVFLKVLLQLEQQKWPLHHDCNRLFDDLSRQSQEAIRAYYDKRQAAVDVRNARIEKMVGFTVRQTFSEALQDSANAFETFRYAYEGRELTSFKGAYLAEAGKKRIVELRPEWGAKLESSGIREFRRGQEAGSLKGKPAGHRANDTAKVGAESRTKLERAFISADRFGSAGKLLFEIRPGFFMYPSVICSALALEIFLKLLLHLEGHSKKARGHDCRKPFKAVSQESQQVIRTAYDSELQKHASRFADQEKVMGFKLRRDFDGALEDAGTAFDDWRYAFEEIRPNEVGSVSFVRRTSQRAHSATSARMGGKPSAVRD